MVSPLGLVCFWWALVAIGVVGGGKVVMIPRGYESWGFLGPGRSVGRYWGGGWWNHGLAPPSAPLGSFLTHAPATLAPRDAVSSPLTMRYQQQPPKRPSDPLLRPLNSNLGPFEPPKTAFRPPKHHPPNYTQSQEKSRKKLKTTEKRKKHPRGD